MGAVIDIGLTDGVRLMRRYGLDAPLPRHLALALLAAVAALLLMAAGAAGYLAGSERAAAEQTRGAAGPVLVGVLLALVVLVIAAAPSRKLRVALQSMRSWELLSGWGVTVRQFVHGKYVGVEAAKAILVVAAYCCFTVPFLLVQRAEGGDAAVAYLGACVLVAVATLRLTVVARDVHRRTRLPTTPTSGRAMRLLRPALLVVLLCGVLAATAWGVESVMGGGVAGAPLTVGSTLADRPWATAAAATVLALGAVVAVSLLVVVLGVDRLFQSWLPGLAMAVAVAGHLVLLSRRLSRDEQLTARRTAGVLAAYVAVPATLLVIAQAAGR